MTSHHKKYAPKLDSQIFFNKSKILEKISTNQVVIIVGQTGCGKSTQIPQYLYQSGFSKNGIIACLHPRCIAAITLAKRVSYETRTTLGTLVGYQVRFDSMSSYDTMILYMTTGYMLRILQDENCINSFSVIIIDEAHERSYQNDIMMGRMKMIMKKNIFIKLVIMSATLNVDEIQEFYPRSVVVSIQETEDQVDVIYRPLKKTKYIEAIKDLVKEILSSTKNGHILVFLPSEEKVRKCKRLLKDLRKPIVLCFYSAMDYDDKMMVFNEFKWKRKVILATNVAETSLTIDGVDFVIDSGFVKRVKYDHENRIEQWVTEKISMAEADQRKGRTGRTGPGTCYRLYEDPEVERNSKPTSIEVKGSFLEVLNQMCEFFEKIKPSRPDYPCPEIKNINLGAIILILKSIGITDIDTFPFIVAPDRKSTELSVTHLKELSLLNNDGTITNLGRKVTSLPLDPLLGKVAAVASQLSCRREVLSIVALCSVMNIFKNPTAKESQKCHKAFNSGHGDLFELLSVYETASRYGFCKEWCNDNGINHSCLKYALMVERQLQWLLPDSLKIDADLSRSKENQIKKAFLSGFFNNVVYAVNNKYQTLAGKPVTLHQNSCLKDCKDVVMGTIMMQSANSKGYVLRNCVTLNMAMLEAFTPQKYKVKLNAWKEILKKITDKSEKCDNTIVS